MPVVTPARASTLTVNAVPSRASFRDTICGSSSSCRRSVVMGTQITPLAYLRMNATSSGRASSAAIVRSPSFSRSSSSTTITIFPRRMSSMASLTDANGPAGATTRGRFAVMRFTFLMPTPMSLGSRSRSFYETLDVLGEHVGLDVHEIAGRQRAECRALGGVWDKGDLKERLAEGRDRERDAVERDEALHHEVAGEALRHGEAQSRRAAALLTAADELCRRVPVSLDEVAAEGRRRRRRGLEIHARAADRAPERRPRERLRDDLDGEPVRVPLHHGEARAGDVDARVAAQ